MTGQCYQTLGSVPNLGEMGQELGIFGLESQTLGHRLQMSQSRTQSTECNGRQCTISHGGGRRSPPPPRTSYPPVLSQRSELSRYPYEAFYSQPETVSSQIRTNSRRNFRLPGCFSLAVTDNGATQTILPSFEFVLKIDVPLENA